MSQELSVGIDRYRYQNDVQIITLDYKLSDSDIKIVEFLKSPSSCSWQLRDLNNGCFAA